MMENYDYEELFQLVEGITEASSITSNIISFALGILMIVALWRIYEKAGEQGWASLIPFYRDYVLYKVSGKKNLFWGHLICSVIILGAVGSMIAEIVAIIIKAADVYSYNNMSDEELIKIGLVFIIAIFVMAICGIIQFILKILQCVGLTQSFGVSGAYAVGLLFLPHIFYSIFAFNSNFVCNGQGNPYMNNPYMNNPYGNPNGYNPQYGQPYYTQPNQPYQPNPQAQPGMTPPYYGQPNQPYQPYQPNPQAQPGMTPPYYGQLNQPNQSNYPQTDFATRPTTQDNAFESQDSVGGDYSEPNNEE